MSSPTRSKQPPTLEKIDDLIDAILDDYRQNPKESTRLLKQLAKQRERLIQEMNSVDKP